MRQSRKLGKAKVALFSLLPCAILLVFAEGIVRILGLAEPSLHSVDVAGGPQLNQADPELFWSLRPNARVIFQGVRVTVNSLGLRGPEIGPKAPNEFRILCLGESTTFGARVHDEETYSAVLSTLLNKNQSARKYTVINAGVSAYSSFQSLKYLELRGFEFEPDVVVFYHEVNDYLPSAIRDASNTEIGVLMTDRQLYESRTQSAIRNVSACSALIQWLQYQWAMRKVQRLQFQQVENPLKQIGMPDMRLGPQMVTTSQGKTRSAQLNEIALGQRVTESERLQNLRDLAAMCKRRGVRLVVVHPSYAMSTRHECVLTRFCQENQVPMLEAYDALHPPSTAADAMFADSWHPTKYGHQRLATALAQFLESQGLLRMPESTSTGR